MLRTLPGVLASPDAVDLILLGVLLEAVVLLAYRYRTGKGVAPRALLATLVSGGSLMLALRFALQTALLSSRVSAAIAVCLMLALVAHIVDLAGRWESSTPPLRP